MPILQRERPKLGHIGLSARSRDEKEVHRGRSWLVSGLVLDAPPPTAGGQFFGTPTAY